MSSYFNINYESASYPLVPFFTGHIPAYTPINLISVKHAVIYGNVAIDNESKTFSQLTWSEKRKSWFFL